MKNKITFPIFALFVFVFLWACSTRKDTFATRNFQALNTKYNVLFNGNEALDKGVLEMNLKYRDHFWDILPVERQEYVAPDVALDLNTTDDKKPTNPLFELAEEKATKAIQKRSIYIDGTERNYQIDEAYMLLGKARYYDQRYVPALEAFNYIIYKSPKSNTINEVKVWREKTNIRLDNDEQAVENLIKLLKELHLEPQVLADANAILAQAYIKLAQHTKAIQKLKIATSYTKNKEEKARYHFILGQLYDKVNYKDSAFAAFQTVINMNRQAPRAYIVHAKLQQLKNTSFKNSDTVAFFKNYNKLLEDRENRPFLDALNHQLGLMYEQDKNTKQAIKYYNLSLKHGGEDLSLVATNYQKLADIHFYNAQYVLAGKYFDSTLTYLNKKTRLFRNIKKKRENLDDVIKYEEIAQKNDSILHILAMNDTDRKQYFENKINGLKQADALKKAKENQLKNGDLDMGKKALSNLQSVPSDFYFYNTSTLALGKIEFQKNWGNRTLKDNWRLINTNSDTDNSPDGNLKNTSNDNVLTNPNDNPKYNASTYSNQLPTKTEEIQKLVKDRNFAYFQLGIIYKEKFAEYPLAQTKLETLLDYKPEERLLLPTLYNLYKIYEITDKNKALTLKNSILSQYPDSRYAQILLQTPGSQNQLATGATMYMKWYQLYSEGDYRAVLDQTKNAVTQWDGDELLPKIELLRANTIGKVEGVLALRKALNYVALTYPNTTEGKSAETFVNQNVPKLEALQINGETPSSWKVLYRIGAIEDKNSQALLAKIKKFSDDRGTKKIYSVDVYTLNENFIVLHGFKSEEIAHGIGVVLKEIKAYSVTEKPIVISNTNYKVVQIKKNIDDYLLDPKKIAKPVQQEIIDNNPKQRVDNEVKRKDFQKPQNTIQAESLNNQTLQEDTGPTLAPPSATTKTKN